MKKKILSLIFILTFLLITPVEAKEINKFYPITDENIELTDTINGDSAIAGNVIDMLGNIDGIGFIAGQTINVNGNLEYGFIAGDNIKIDGKISKNIYAAGNNITFTKNTNIGRDIFMIANNIKLNGNLNRNINISATKVTIEENTIIKGNINIEAQEIIIKNNASLNKTLKYNNDAKTNISNKAKINKTKTYENKEENNINTTQILQSILNMVVIFLVITIIFPQITEKCEKLYEKKSNNYLKNIGIGFLLLICTPMIALLLLASNIGIYLGLIILTLYIICIYLSYIISGFLLGNLLLGKLMKLNTNKYLSGIIGIISLKLLMLIPVLGTLISIITITLGIATIWKLIEKEEINTKKDNKVIEAKIKTKAKK